MILKNLVFEGGGVKGIAFVGALQQLYKHNLLTNIVNVAGTSAGSGVATLFACGYNTDELKNIVWKCNFNTFKDDSFGIFRDLWRLYYSYGFHDGKELKIFHEKLIYDKLGIPNITFEQFYQLTQKDLTITGTCLTDSNIHYFNKDNTPNMIVSDAIQISMSIPYYFKPIVYNNKIFVDGGLLNNFPVDYYDLEDIDRNPIINEETLGLQLESLKEFDHMPNKISSFADFSTTTLNVVLNEISELRLGTKCDKRKLIKINTGTVSATDFNLGEEQKQFLYNAGITAADLFIKKCE